MNSPYENLAAVTAEIRQRAEAGDWAGAARTARRLADLSAAGHLGPARGADRAAIEAALADIAAISARAGPLKDDIGRMLDAFGPAPSGDGPASPPDRTPRAP
jgi:hypothetical protein